MTGYPKCTEGVTVLCILLVFLALNASLFLEGYHGDIRGQQTWGNQALKNGVSSLYAEHTTDYPPLYLYVLKFNAWVNLRLFRNTEVMTRNYVFISKMIPTVCNLTIGLGIFAHFRKRSFKKALLGMCLYLFNPAIVYNTAYWGQVDSVNALFMFFCILFLVNERYMWSTICISLAVLTKIQSIILLPLVLAIVLVNSERKDVFKMLFANAAVVLTVLMPFIRGGVIVQLVRRCLFSVGWQPYVTANAYNIWFLVSPRTPEDWLTTLRDTYTLSGISLRSIGFALIIAYTLLVLYQVLKHRNLSSSEDSETLSLPTRLHAREIGKRFLRAGKLRLPSVSKTGGFSRQSFINKKNAVIAAAGMTLAFFILPTEIHERYLFPFFPLLSLVVLDNMRYARTYLILTFTHLINLMIAFPFQNRDTLFYGTIQTVLDSVTKMDEFALIGIASAIAAVNIITFIHYSKIGILQGILNNQTNGLADRRSS